MSDFSKIKKEDTIEGQGYIMKAKKVSNDIKNVVFLVIICMTIMLYLLNTIISPISLNLPINDLSYTFDGFNEEVKSSLIDVDYNNLSVIFSMLPQVLSTLMLVGVNRAIILHSRNIEDFTGFKNIFKSVTSNTFSQIITSTIFLVINLLLKIVFVIISVFVLFFGNGKISILKVLFLITLILLFIIIKSIVNIIGSSSMARVSLTDSSPLESIKKVSTKSKKKENIKEYIKINLFYFLKILILIISTILIISILFFIRGSISLMVALVAMISLYTFIKIFIDFQVLSSVFIGEYILNDDLLKIYPSVDQSLYVSKKL